MTAASRIAMPGQIWRLAAGDPAGPLFVTGFGPDPLKTVLTAVNRGTGPAATRRPRRQRGALRRCRGRRRRSAPEGDRTPGYDKCGGTHGSR